MEINENNVREFCNVIDCNQGENGKRGWGKGWRGSLHTDCQCLGESLFPQARGQAELLQEWG